MMYEISTFMYVLVLPEVIHTTYPKSETLCHNYLLCIHYIIICAVIIYYV